MLVAYPEMPPSDYSPSANAYETYLRAEAAVLVKFALADLSNGKAKSSTARPAEKQEFTKLILVSANSACT